MKTSRQGFSTPGADTVPDRGPSLASGGTPSGSTVERPGNLRPSTLILAVALCLGYLVLSAALDGGADTSTLTQSRP